jgi:hypothetical protein
MIGIGIAVAVAPRVVGPSASKDISGIHEDQDGEDKIYEEADDGRKLKEDHKS